MSTRRPFRSYALPSGAALNSLNSLAKLACQSIHRNQTFQVHVLIRALTMMLDTRPMLLEHIFDIFEQQQEHHRCINRQVH